LVGHQSLTNQEPGATELFYKNYRRTFDELWSDVRIMSIKRNLKGEFGLAGGPHDFWGLQWGTPGNFIFGQNLIEVFIILQISLHFWICYVKNLICFNFQC